MILYLLSSSRRIQCKLSVYYLLLLSLIVLYRMITASKLSMENWSSLSHYTMILFNYLYWTFHFPNWLATAYVCSLLYWLQWIPSMLIHDSISSMFVVLLAMDMQMCYTLGFQLYSLIPFDVYYPKKVSFISCGMSLYDF